jgi:short-subunit dehydrogenase
MKANAVICGGSRGLGRAIAHALAEAGYGVAICARSKDEVDQVRAELERLGVRVHAEVCDLRDEEQASRFIAVAEEVLGPIDVLVANAATISVAPIETRSSTDFDDAMRSIFYTALHPILAAIPRMRDRKRGTIAMVTSIGGFVGMPHLSPYSAAKFATVGLAESLGAELRKDGIHVLTIVPGLMRTGSHVRATYKGNATREYAWFSASAMAPLVSIDADVAAKRIVRAIERKKSRLVLTLPARIAARLHDLLPGVFGLVLEVAGALLPKAPPRPSEAEGRVLASTGRRSLRRTRRLAARHAQW